MRMQKRSALWLVVLLAPMAISAGCSGASDASASNRQPANPSAPGAAAGNAGGGSASASKNAFGNAAANPMGPNVSGNGTAGAASAQPQAPLSAANACGVGMLTAERKPVNMLVMFDRSGSMNDNNKWPNATAALTAFFQSPGAAGLRVALRFFPHDSPAVGCTDNGCDAVACSEPLVPLGPLTADSAPQDAQEGALVNAIRSSAPGGGRGGGGRSGGGGTPIYAALDGALRWATSFRAMRPSEKTVVIFVTDGEPSGCDEDFNHISALAAAALAASGIPTYAIGLEGSSMVQMDQLARAGGTMKGIFIGNSANAEQELLTALNAIRGETLSCDIAMPKPAANMPIDPTKVNVTFTSSAGMAATLGQVPDANRCSRSKAWYYDAPQAPTRIVLCPAACDFVRADPKAKLEILLGCETACGGLDVDCGSKPPPTLPPVL